MREEGSPARWGAQLFKAVAEGASRRTNLPERAILKGEPQDGEIHLGGSFFLCCKRATI